MFTVTFSASGLAPDANWSVKLGVRTLETSVTYLIFSVPNGTFGFTVQPPPGDSADPASGSVVVNGTPVVVSVTFASLHTGGSVQTLLGLPTVEAVELLARSRAPRGWGLDRGPDDRPPTEEGAATAPRVDGSPFGRGETTGRWPQDGRAGTAYPMARRLTVQETFYYDASPAKVYAALTEPNKLSRWFVQRAEMTLAPDAPFRFVWRGGYSLRGKVKSAVPGGIAHSLLARSFREGQGLPYGGAIPAAKEGTRHYSHHHPQRV